MIAKRDLPTYDRRTLFEQEFDAGLGITLGQAAALLPAGNGRRAHTTTLWRWHTKGKHGIHLECVPGLRGDYITTAAAVRRFLRAVADVEAAMASGAHVASVDVDPNETALLNMELDMRGVGVDVGCSQS